ncbi:MAG TPA: histidine--tRNA ligase [Gemmataceae bacterium]
MSDLIEPRTLSGFRDYPPELMIPRERMLEKAREVYRSYGFAPIDTPALEYAEILLGKGGEETDRQLYRFRHHSHDVALRFDLTVPFARFAAQHIGRLGTPFKRYHMGPVWRGERAQRGRYREFWQCDFDTIGTTSNAADIEAVLVIHDLMAALGFGRFEVRVNNRLVLNGLLEQHGLSDRAVPVLRALDKLPKVGPEGVIAELTGTSTDDAVRAGLTVAQAEQLLAMVQARGENAEVLDRLERDFGSNPRSAEGIARLRELLAVTAAAGIPPDRVRLDLSICRGLDYYTGTVYETFLLDKPDIGSVCSGGRYDNLAGLYTRQSLPGVGASLGLDRLLAAMEELGLLEKTATPAPVLVVQFSAERLGDYQRLGRLLRAAGVGVEVYPDAKKIGQQLRYAEQRGFRFAVIAGPEEFARGVWKVKNLAEREEKPVPEGELAAYLRGQLGG